jgi:hypothetical protein
MRPGTKSTLSEDCRLARGNPQCPGISGLFNESKISQSNYLMDVKKNLQIGF